MRVYENRNLMYKPVVLPFLISSPLMSLWRSNVKLLGATYSAAAVSSALEMNPDMKGRFMMLGRILFIGTTEIVI